MPTVEVDERTMADIARLVDELQAGVAKERAELSSIRDGLDRLDAELAREEVDEEALDRFAEELEGETDAGRISYVLSLNRLVRQYATGTAYKLAQVEARALLLTLVALNREATADGFADCMGLDKSPDLRLIPGGES